MEGNGLLSFIVSSLSLVLIINIINSNYGKMDFQKLTDHRKGMLGIAVGRRCCCESWKAEARLSQ